METDALVIGAGPVGLTMAAELIRHGVSTRVVDSAIEPASTSRAIAVHSRTLELLELLDLTSEFLLHGVRLTSAEFHTEDGTPGRIRLDEIDAPYPFILSLPQAVTERLLAQRLSQLGSVVERVTFLSLKQSADEVTSTLLEEDGCVKTIRSRWVIGCDGAHSAVRHSLGLPFMGAPYPEQFLLADVKIVWELHANEVQAFFHRDGLLFAFPLPGDRHRIIAEISREPEHELSETPTFDELRRLFAKRVSAPAELTDPVWISRFRIHHRVVNHYREQRVFVAGDAAHIHSPAGGQGMNIGMQDAINLAWKLGLRNAGKANDSILDTYSEERRPVAHSVITLTDRLTTVGTLRSPFLQRVRNAALPLFASWGVLHHAFVNELSELKLNYRGSSIVEGQGSFHGGAPHPGDRAPLSKIGEGTLGGILTGNCHHLLLFAGDRPHKEELSVFAAIRRDFAAVYPELIQVHTFVRSASTSTQDVISDSEGNVHRDYGADRPCLYLVRPDRYIAYRSAPPDDAAVHRFLRDAYGFRPKAAEVFPHHAS